MVLPFSNYFGHRRRFHYLTAFFFGGGSHPGSSEEFLREEQRGVSTMIKLSRNLATAGGRNKKTGRSSHANPCGSASGPELKIPRIMASGTGAAWPMLCPNNWHRGAIIG